MLTRSTTLVLAALALAAVTEVRGQAVDVTVALDQARLGPGESTTLRVYGWIDGTLQASSDRIFSWYIDVLADKDAVAAADYDALEMAASDNIPAISSPGSTQGANRHGIHNTFMNLPGAGKSAPIELAAVPVTASGAGSITFSVRAGTSIPNLSEDFIVAPTGGGTPYTGGDYGAASATLTVAESELVELNIEMAVRGTRVSWTPIPGVDHYLQFRDDRQMGSTGWQTLPGGPHNTGAVLDTTRVIWRSYRLVRIDP